MHRALMRFLSLPRAARLLWLLAALLAVDVLFRVA
jgi:hypothetical protein